MATTKTTKAPEAQKAPSRKKSDSAEMDMRGSKSQVTAADGKKGSTTTKKSSSSRSK